MIKKRFSLGICIGCVVGLLLAGCMSNLNQSNNTVRASEDNYLDYLGSTNSSDHFNVYTYHDKVNKNTVYVLKSYDGSESSSISAIADHN